MNASKPTRDELLRHVEALETRLRQLEQEAAGEARPSADLEALGHYASSVAHDLNNLLVGILGNAGLALMDLSSFSSCRPLIQEVEEAALRAAGLTNEMLALTQPIEATEAEADGAEADGAEAGQTEVTEAERAEAEVAIGKPASPAPNSMWRGEGLMLVVDDEQMVRVLAQRVLEKFGFQVMTAEDGRQGLEVFRPHSGEFVGVLLDVTMPHLDGASTFRELRKIRPDIKVILSSGYDELEATRSIVDDGLAGFLHKPYMPMELIDKVREVLAA
ncbi:MAG: response regulator [Acidobacteriota bacterium]